MTIQKNKYSTSFLTWIFIAVALCTMFSVYQQSSNREFIESDGYAYYCYLPATFIYHDLSLKYVNDLPGDLYMKYWLTSYEGKDYRISKMTIGVALMMMPFFLIGHLYAYLFGYPLTGFSHPYQDMVAVAALFYCLLGLFFVRKALLKLFNENVTSIVLLLLIGATTLYNYSMHDPSMSHVYSFFAFSLMVWFTIRWHETFLPQHFLWLCLSVGFILLIRQINVLACIFPIAYGVQDKFTVQKKMNFLRSRWTTVLSGACCILLLFIPQFMLWKYQTGMWYFDPYVSEHFYFNNPHVIEVLFGFRSGWLLYTPLMILSLIGIVISVKEKQPFGLFLLIFIPVIIYILSCWWCWTFGGTFSYRPMVDFYPMLSLPLAVFITAMIRRKALFLICVPLLFFFTVLNLFQQLQFERGILHYSDMTIMAYKAIFGKTQYPENYSSLLDPFDIENAHAGKPLRNMKSLSDFGFTVYNKQDVKIKSATGKFLSVEENFNLLLVAASDSFTKSCQFILTKMNNGKCTLTAWNKCFLYTLDWGEQRATMEIVSSREIFNFIDLGNDRFALKASNGKYLTVELNDPFYVYASSAEISDRSVFRFEH